MSLTALAIMVSNDALALATGLVGNMDRGIGVVNRLLDIGWVRRVDCSLLDHSCKCEMDRVSTDYMEPTESQNE